MHRVNALGALNYIEIFLVEKKKYALKIDILGIRKHIP